MLENTSASALWTAADGRCIGLLAERPARGDGPKTPVPIVARATILATGGAAALWERTTNPRGVIGAGMSLAHHAGAALADMEFMQFHPTALRTDDEHDAFLITEAIRGEGAKLLDQTGERFVDELQPRDAVALAVEAVLRAGGEVFLDMRAIDMTPLPEHRAQARRGGHRPGAASSSRSRRRPTTRWAGSRPTSTAARPCPGLFAVGECADTGLHGANRLASNSLAECFVFGRRAALAAVNEPAAPVDPGRVPSAGPSPVPPASTRKALWTLAGIHRNRRRPGGAETTIRSRSRGSSPRARSPARKAAEPISVRITQSHIDRSTVATPPLPARKT